MHCNKARQSSFRGCHCISHPAFDRVCVVVVVVVADKPFLHLLSVHKKACVNMNKQAWMDMQNTPCIGLRWL